MFLDLVTVIAYNIILFYDSNEEMFSLKFYCLLFVNQFLILVGDIYY